MPPLKPIKKGSADQRVQQRKIQTGRRVADRVEVLSGLEPTTAIAVRGAGFLNDGDLVRVSNTAPVGVQGSATVPTAAAPASAAK